LLIFEQNDLIASALSGSEVNNIRLFLAWVNYSFL